MSRKEYELNYAVLRYACACMRDGEWGALREMGFGHEELEALRGLTLEELARLEASVKAHVLHVELDRTGFWMLMKQARDQTAAQDTQRALLCSGAPLEMMAALYGMGARDYAKARRALRVASGVGRPPEPDEDTARRVWIAWEQVTLGAAPRRPEEWLRIAHDSGVDLRILWRLAQRWRGAERQSVGAVATGDGHGRR